MDGQRPGVKIGGRVRQLRADRGLSLRALATRSGFSPSFISQLEADAVAPSIPSLEKIARVLGVTLTRFFSALEEPARRLVRRDERTVYCSDWSRSTVAALTDSGAERKLDAFELAVEPGGRSGSGPTASWQDALLVLLDGTLAVTTADGELVLEAGDAAYFAAGEPFGWENRADTAAALLLLGATNGSGAFPEITVGITPNQD